MKTLAIVIILLLLALLAIAVWPARYDYRALAVPEAQFRTVMDSLGADGWELVAAHKQPSGASTPSYELVVKRRTRFLVSDRHSSNTALAKILEDASKSTTAPSTRSSTTTNVKLAPVPIVTKVPVPESTTASHVVEVSAQEQFDERLRAAKATGRVFMDGPANVYHKPTCPSVKPWMRDGFVSVAKLSGMHPASDCYQK